MNADRDDFITFAAPKLEDIARWDALSGEEKRIIAEIELAKGMTGNAQSLTTELKYRIFGDALTKTQEAHEGH